MLLCCFVDVSIRQLVDLSFCCRIDVSTSELRVGLLVRYFWLQTVEGSPVGELLLCYSVCFCVCGNCELICR